MPQEPLQWRFFGARLFGFSTPQFPSPIFRSFFWKGVLHEQRLAEVRCNCGGYRVEFLRVREHLVFWTEPAQETPEATPASTEVSNPPAKENQQPKDKTRQAQTATTATAEYHFSLAQAYSAEGNSDRAIEEYKLTLLFDQN